MHWLGWYACPGIDAGNLNDPDGGMKLLRSLTLAAALLLVGSAAATAQQTMQFNGTATGYNDGQYYVGTYLASYYPSGPQIDVFCVDYYHEINNGQIWTANFSNLATSNLSLTRLGLSGWSYANSLLMYEREAWLASQFAVPANNSNNTWVGIAHAMWYLTSGNSALVDSYSTPWLSALATAQEGGFTGMNFAQWSVVTDVTATGEGTAANPGPGTQEFLTRTVTPEPATLLLFGTGLLLLVGVGFVKRSAV